MKKAKKKRKPKEMREKAWAYKIGRTVAELREKKDLKQEVVARASGMGRKTLSDLENGNRAFTIDSLISVLRAMDVDIWQLFGGKPDGLKRPIEYEVMHDMLDGIIATKREELIFSIRTMLAEMPRKQ